MSVMISFEVKEEIPVSSTPMGNGFSFMQFQTVWSKIKPRKHYKGESLTRYINHLKEDERKGKVRNIVIQEVA